MKDSLDIVAICSATSKQILAIPAATAATAATSATSATSATTATAATAASVELNLLGSQLLLSTLCHLSQAAMDVSFVGHDVCSKTGCANIAWSASRCALRPR